MVTDDIEYLKERVARLERTVEALMEIIEERRDEIERLRNIIIGIALNKQVWEGFNFD